jgi:hypothetical protein
MRERSTLAAAPLAADRYVGRNRDCGEMRSKHTVLLTIDAVVNLLLGAILLFFPAGLMDFLGLPETDTFFYPSILGAVIFGIGIALLLELVGGGMNARGLGLDGAIAINLCGDGALMVWLLAVPLKMPLRGKIVLWSVAVLVLAIGVAEITARSSTYKGNAQEHVGATGRHSL